MMGSLFAMSVAALLVVGAQFWYIIVHIIMHNNTTIPHLFAIFPSSHNIITD